MNGGIGRGPDKASVTIVEFTDFHCLFCKRAQSTVAEVLRKYGDRVRHVHRDFPIDRLDERANLVKVGLIDSLAVLEIVMYLEDTYGIDFMRKGIDPGELVSVTSILDLIEREAA